LFKYIFTALLILVKPGLQEVREKEQFHDHEKNKNFDQDNDPQFLTDCHPPESIIVEAENPYEDIIRHPEVDF
jgi:hypothetical protein